VLDGCCLGPTAEADAWLIRYGWLRMGDDETSGCRDDCKRKDQNRD